MNDCPNGDLRDLLPDFLHDRLTAADRAVVEAHLAGCDDCRDELELLRGLRGTLRRMPAVDVSAIVAKIPAYRAPARRSWGGGWRAAAAVALIAVGGTSVAIANRVGVQSPSLDPHSVSPTLPDTPLTVAQMPHATDPAVNDPRRATALTVARAPRELAVSGAVSDLSDRELSTLLDGIETLDALPSADVDNAVPVAPIAPADVESGSGAS
jgi:Putative zinc-finger